MQRQIGRKKLKKKMSLRKWTQSGVDVTKSDGSYPHVVDQKVKRKN